MKDLKQLIRESINEYIREIDAAGENAACEAKIKAIGEAIELREKKMNKDGLDEVYHDMLDKGKMKELASEIKTLKKSLAKYEKQLAKLKSKGEKAEEMSEEIIDEVSIDENAEDSPYKVKSKDRKYLSMPGMENFEEEERYDEEGNVDPKGMYDSGASYIGALDTATDKAKYDKEDEGMSMYEILNMQKLAGIISESEYNKKIEEAKKKPSSGLTKKEKSSISKKAHAGKDIGKKGKGFEKVAKTAEKQYGSKEAGEKVAAAAMWKGAAKSLKEEVQALFEVSIPKGWKSMGVDPEPDPEEDMEVESYGAPMEGWDKEHYDYVNIMKTPENKYYVSTYIAFGDIKDGDEQYDSLEQAQTEAIKIMNDIKSEW